MMSLFAESRVETHSEKKKSPDGRSGSPMLGMSGGPQPCMDWKESSSCPKKKISCSEFERFFVGIANSWQITEI